MTKALLIDAGNQTITEVEVNGLRDMQQFVGGYIEAAYFWEDRTVLYVDEEGLLKAQDQFFRISVRPDQPLAGNGLLVGSDAEGENADVTLSLAEVIPMVEFLDRRKVAAWGKANASEPAMTISSIGPDGRVEETILARYGSLIDNVLKTEE